MFTCRDIQVWLDLVYKTNNCFGIEPEHLTVLVTSVTSDCFLTEVLHTFNFLLPKAVSVGNKKKLNE